MLSVKKPEYPEYVLVSYFYIVCVSIITLLKLIVCINTVSEVYHVIIYVSDYYFFLFFPRRYDIFSPLDLLEFYG